MAARRTSLAHRSGEEQEGGETDLEVSERERMRSLLPAVETDRILDDWGRSERVEGIFDATLVEFFYRYWFRCEVEGIENVPADGGALLVSNHAGALPPDAAMIGKAIRDEHDHPRPLYMTVEHFFKGYPGFSTLLPKIGCVPAHPANVHRLLYDERQLVLVFPEGRKGTEKLVKDRYKVQRFGRGGFVEAAMRGRGARSCPSAWSAPRRPRRSSPSPSCCRARPGSSTSRSPRPSRGSGRPACSATCPAKFKIRFLEPIDTARMGAEPAEDKALVQSVAQEVRARIQENLHEMVGSGSRSGSDERQARGRSARSGRGAAPGPDHRTVDATGVGASPRRSSRSPRSRRSSASTPATRPASSSAPSSSRSPTSTA